MKRLLGLIGFFIIILSSIVYAQSGPVIHYIAEDDLSDGIATDSSVNGLDGTCTFGTTCPLYLPTGSQDGDGAYDFDGSNDYINVGNDNILEITGDITITAWVYHHTNTGADEIIGKGQCFKSTCPWGVYINRGNNIMFAQNDGSFGQDTLRSTGTVPLNEWIHVAAVRSGGTRSIYLNGTLDTGPTAWTRTPTPNGKPTLIGEIETAIDSPFDGILDDIRVYDRALSANEIQQLYNGSTGPICGDNNIDPGEECDDGANNGACPATCSNQCTLNNCTPILNGSIAVLGCSNTGQHAEGYRTQPSLDLLSHVTRNTPPNDIGGQTLQLWTDHSSRGWNVTENLEPVGGYAKAWFQICIRDDQHNGSINATHQSQLQFVVNKLGTDYGIAPSDIYVSGLNYFPSGHVCPQVGVGGSRVANDVADWGAANIGVQRGPVTSISTVSNIDPDGCHLTLTGEEEVALQVISFFDQGLPDVTPPFVLVNSPSNDLNVSGFVSVAASASDNVEIVGVQFLLNGSNLGVEDTSIPYNISWNTTGLSNGFYALSAMASDSAGNNQTSDIINVYVNNFVPPVCGNNITESGEECDDGINNGACPAGCSASCTLNNCTPLDVTSPVRFNGQPSGTLPSSTTQTAISLDTDESATCKYDLVPGTSYNIMQNNFSATGGTSHFATVLGLQDGQTYNYYVKCQDNFGNANTNDFLITFNIQATNVTIFDIGLEVQTNSCTTSSCIATATCSPNKNVLYGLASDSFSTCSLSPSDCNIYCLPGINDCSITSSSNQASVYVVCGFVI